MTKNSYSVNSGSSKFRQALIAIGSLVSLIACLPVLEAQEISISASVDRQTVELGESITLNIVISGSARSLPRPILPDLSEFDVYYSGTSSNFSIGMGTFVNEVTYSYALAPKRVGTFVIGPVMVQHKGNTYSTQPIEIIVSPASSKPAPAPPPTTSRPSPSRQSADFFIEQQVDNRNPYVAQQVTLTMRFYQGQSLYQQPTLQWPTYSGFWVEDLPPQRSFTTTINGRLYRVTEIKRALFPMVTGKLILEPVTVVVPPDVFSDFFDDPFGIFGRRAPRSRSELVLRSERIVLNVKPLPEEGKPSNFSGAVGKFDLKVAIDKDTVEIDQPVTLKAAITGIGNIKSIPAIEIAKPDNFRLYDSGSNESISKNDYVVSGAKRFEWVLIPMAPGTYELPTIRLAYFDPFVGQYKVVSGNPGTLYVRKAPFSLTSTPALAKNVIPASKTNFNYIVTELGPRRNARRPYESRLLWLLQLVPAAWLLSLSAYSLRRRRLTSDVAYARRKLATKAAKKALQAAAKGLHNREQFFALLYAGIVGFISDKFNVSAAGLTNTAIVDLLKKTGRFDALLDEFAEFLNVCDAGRFSPVKPDAEQMKRLYSQAEYILSELDRGLR